MVATGAPAARYSPTEARRSLTAPSMGDSDDGVGQLLARQLELGSPLEEHALADAHLLDRVLVAALRHLERGDRGVHLGPRDQLLLPEPLGPIAGEPRLARARRRA